MDSGPLQTTLLSGSRRLLSAHARELPQRDDLCGAFCGALALSAAGFERRGTEPLDQDAVAVAAGSVVSIGRELGTLPGGEAGRRDYRLGIPTIDDPDVSGTTASGVARAVAALSENALQAVALSGPWSTQTLGGLFDTASALEHPVTLIANLATHHLWGGRPSVEQLLDHLYEGSLDGPDPDWDVGHFACVFARTSGPRGSLYALADTYPALGNEGVHIQPQELLAAAIERSDMPAGGVLAVVNAQDADALRTGASAAGLREGLWDNGTVTDARPQ